MRFNIFTGYLVVVLLMLTACDSEQNAQVELTTLRIGVLPDQTIEYLRQRYTPLFEHLSSEIGMPYAFVPVESYAELLERFAEGRVDLVRLGGFTFLKALDAGAVPLVSRDVDARFTSVFVVPANSKATDVTQLQGGRLAFGSELSTSGHLMPRHFLLKRDITPEAFFNEVYYSGAHDQTVYDIRDGNADLGAVNKFVIMEMLADGRLAPDDVRILWETPPYTDYVWAVRSEVTPALRRHIRNAFLDLSRLDEKQAQILDRLNAGSFLPTAIHDFAALQRISAATGLLENEG